MKSNYNKIGDHIRLIDKRNKDLKIDLLLGLSITKNFIPSVANIVGTNMANYKIIKKNQFACSIMQVRRDKKMPVALLKDFDEAIISQAYPVFEIIDEDLLLPEYLMMWFSRSEFDRQACFLAVGGVRGSLEWEDFLDIELPVPSIEKQRAIVKEYNTVVDRIELNEQLNLKLEETAQAIYKEWFVDYEFPNEEGKPYKSSGGKMVWNEELDKEVPEGWEVKTLDKLCTCLDNQRKPLSGEQRNEMKGLYPYYGAMSIVDYIDDYIYDGTFLLMSEDGANVVDENGRPALQYVWGKFWLNNHAHILKGDEIISTEFLKLALGNQNVAHLVTGAAQPKINQKNMMSIQLIKPNNIILESFNKKVYPIYQYYKTNREHVNKLDSIIEILLSKMSKVKEVVI